MVQKYGQRTQAKNLHNMTDKTVHFITREIWRWGWGVSCFFFRNCVTCAEKSDPVIQSGKIAYISNHFCMLIWGKNSLGKKENARSCKGRNHVFVCSHICVVAWIHGLLECAMRPGSSIFSIRGFCRGYRTLSSHSLGAQGEGGGVREFSFSRYLTHSWGVGSWVPGHFHTQVGHASRAKGTVRGLGVEVEGGL
jgi:hypothetical protein